MDARRLRHQNDIVCVVAMATSERGTDGDFQWWLQGVTYWIELREIKEING